MVELLSAITVKVNWSRPYRRFEGVFPDQFLLQNRDAPVRPRGSDNFDWRDLRGLGKLLAWRFSVMDLPQGARHGNGASRLATAVCRIDEAGDGSVLEGGHGSSQRSPGRRVDCRQRRTRSRSLGRDAPPGV